ncbi:hypothetical protein Busp01_55210 [Trinickia caryophylli]|nr:hypothetical protein Busp01_55210 [Trinickia caryophylli]
MAQSPKPQENTNPLSQMHAPPSRPSGEPLSAMPPSNSGSPVRHTADNVAIDIVQPSAVPDPVVRSSPQQLASTESMRQKVGKFAPAVDALAAGASLAASRVSSGSVASTVTGAVSGLLWGGSAAMSEAGNTQPASRLASAANLLNFGAGALSTAAVFNTDSTQTNLGYASSAAWGLSAFTSMAHAAFDTTRNKVSRGLQMASGVANLAAAGLSAASVRASSQEDTASAAWYGTASSLSWMAGAALAYGSARTASNSSAHNMPPVASESTVLGPGAVRSFGTIQSV